jgi:hypothetical protein
MNSCMPAVLQPGVQNVCPTRSILRIALPTTRMFLYLLLFMLANYRDVDAAPPPTWMDRAATQDSKPELQRTLFGIIWSCLSTIIICAWTSVHPNVPPPNQWKARWNRLTLMFWMITAPELVLAWAVRQYFAAREIRNAYNERYPGAY